MSSVLNSFDEFVAAAMALTPAQRSELTMLCIGERASLWPYVFRSQLAMCSAQSDLGNVDRCDVLSILYPQAKVGE